MGFATHLGPWLLGTVNNTTGTTAGTVRNTGATVVAQTGTMAFGDTSAVTLFALPAGAEILHFIVDATTAFNATTNNVVTLKIGSTTLAAVTGTAVPIAVGRYMLGVVNVSSVVYAITQASVATFANVGTADVLVTGTFAGTGTPATTGAATVTCIYSVRGSDGVAYSTSA